VSAKVKHHSEGNPWWLTTVYGPQEEQEKIIFLDELRQLRLGRVGPWILYGDFNLICMAADKNNGRLNRRLMGKMRRFLQDLEMLELHLQGRLYTWSNEQARPTLVCIDRAFAFAHGCDRFPHYRLHALSSCLDHTPLLLHTDSSHVFHHRFMFESTWPKFSSYLDAVVAGWNYPVQSADPFHTLVVKFRNTARALKSWSQKFVGSIRLQLVVAKEVIFQLDRAQAHLLSSDELVLRRELKFKCLELASLARSIARQHSHLTFLKESNANTRFFHLQACHRGRKSFIDHLLHHGTTVVHESEKAQLVFDHFDAILGAVIDRTAALDLNALGVSMMQLTGLDHCFSEDEVWQIVRALPPVKAPGPDGFSWPFLFDVLRHMGFSERVINWLSVLFSTASTRILLNGLPGGRICHGRGLRQGDLLSPLLFVLAMDVLNSLFRRADASGLLTPLQPSRNTRYSPTPTTW
jgi:hypothetical protein